MRSSAFLALAACAVVSIAYAQERAALGLGRTPSQSELTTRMISVAPDGTGLPRGGASAREGRAVYEAQCAACHGAKGEGVGEYPALVGGKGSLQGTQPLLTVGSFWPYATTVWDYINRAMPYQDAGSLSPRDVYAVTAYVLFLNGIVGESQILDSRTLPRVRMPNREGFIDDPRPDVPVRSSPLTHAATP